MIAKGQKSKQITAIIPDTMHPGSMNEWDEWDLLLSMQAVEEVRLNNKRRFIVILITRVVI